MSKAGNQTRSPVIDLTLIQKWGFGTGVYTILTMVRHVLNQFIRAFHRLSHDVMGKSMN
jgi:hypothetical protein